MDSTSTEIAKDFQPFFRVYKDGRIERYHEADFLPPSDDPKTGVSSKDFSFSPEHKVSARLYMPKIANNNQKLPLLVYIHGGAFCIESALSSLYHNYLNHLVAEANVVAVSIEYRLAPEHPIPICYDDSWAVLRWVILNSSRAPGPEAEPWLRVHADFTRMFLAGDSAGANIAHDLALRLSDEGRRLGEGLKLKGMALIHPFFGNEKPDRIWTYICSEPKGKYEPKLNPAAHPNLLSKLVCEKVLVCVAEQDPLRQRGCTYYEALKNSGWPGELKIIETKGESHVFHLLNPSTENAAIFLKQVAYFFN